MKRHISLSLLFLIFTFSAFSQYRIGGQIGLNDCNMGYDDKTSYQVISQFYGLNIGAVGEYSITPDLTIRGGLIFSQKGMNSETKTSGKNDDYTLNKYRLKINYLDIPILYHDFAQKARGGQVKALINVGPVFSFALTGKKVISDKVFSGIITPADSTQKLTFGSSGKYNLFNFGIHIGGGVELFDMLTIELFFNKGLSMVGKGTHLQNSVFGLSVGYIYKLGR